MQNERNRGHRIQDRGNASQLGGPSKEGPADFVFGVIFQNGFSPKAVQPEALVFRKNPRAHLEVQGSFGDEGTFQECQKS